MTKPPIPETKNRYAICVGINQYAASAQVSDLRYAEQDAQALYTLLLQHGFEEENCRLLLGSEATLDAIYQALEGFVLTKPDRDDLVLFFFAGHGVPLCIDEGRKGKDARCEVFLTSYDFDRYKVMDNRGAWLDYRLRMGRLREGIFEETLSEKVLFLFDCCYSGDFHRSVYQARSGEQLASQYITTPFAQSSAGHIVLSSCLPHQTSREDEKLQHGVFTYHLLEALEGRIPEAIRPNGWITMGSLFDSLSEKLPDDQRPVKSGVELDTFKLLCYPDRTTIVPATSTPSPSHIQSEKESQLKAMIADHSTFMRDRLSSFVGRQQELEELRQRIATIQQTGGYVTITGQAGQGKSSIIAKLVEEYRPEQVAHHFIPFNPGPDHQVGLLRNLMARLICKYHLSEIYVASESRPALRDYFPKVLREIVEKGGQEVIFIDGLDQLEEDQIGGRDLSFLPNNPPPGIVFVLGTRPNDTLKPLELLKPHHEYLLPNLSRSDFDLILQHRQVHLERGLADRFYEAMEQNALYLDLVAKELLETREISPEDIINRISSDPDYLFTLTIERLKRGDKILWKEVVYPILGLLLAAREPLSRKQIAQILGVEDYRCRESMMKLGGLVTEDGLQRYSLFHLKLRDYLRQDEHHPTKEYLFAVHEEEQWHLVLADWCEQGGLQTIWQDVKTNSAEQERRIYARKHYITHLYYAQVWDRLFAVLDAQEYGKAKNRLYDPSTRSYAQDLDLGRRAAAWEGWTLEEGIAYLPHLWYYTLLRSSLTSRADRYPIAAFRLLVQLRYMQEAVGLAELLTEPLSKVKVFREIVEEMGEQAEPESERLKILLRASEIAKGVGERTEIWEHIEQVQILEELGRAWVQEQRWEQAKEVIGSIQKGEERARALVELARGLVQAQEWGKAKEVIGSIQKGEERAKALVELAGGFVQMQEWEQAKKAWGKAKEVIGSIQEEGERARALVELARGFVQMQEWEQAKEMIGSIQEEGERARALVELARGFVQVQEWEQAKGVIGSIQEEGERARALVGLAGGLVQAQEWEQAKEVIDSVQEKGERARALVGLAGGLVQAQEWEQAKKVWKQAKGVIGSIQKGEERARALEELIRGLVQAQEWEQAKEVIGSIQEGEERARALVELAGGLVQAQEWEQAKKVWKQAKGVIGSIQEKEERARALVELARGFVQAQEWEQAKKVWEQAKGVIGSIQEEGERARALEELIRGLVQAQEWEQAKEVIQEEGERARALEELIRGLVQAQEWEQAKEVIQEEGERVWALEELIRGLVQAQEWEQAKEVIQEEGERVWALVGLAGGLVQAQEWEQAKEVIGSIQEEGERAKALVGLARGLVQAQEWEQAKEVIGSIQEEGEQTWALERLARGLVRAQEWEQAKEVIGSIQKGGKRAWALVELARGFMQVQEWEQAKKVWEQAKGVIGSIQEEGERIRALEKFARGFVQMQEWEQAKEVIGSIQEERKRAEVLVGLARGLVQVQEWEQAKEVIGSIQEEGERVWALVGLAGGLVQAQEWEQAKKVWEQAKEVIGSIQEERKRAEVLVGLARGFVQVQEWEQAKEVIGSIQEEGERVWALVGLARGLVQVQEWEQAKEVIGSIQEEGKRVWALVGLAGGLVQAQEWEQAKKVWEQAKGVIGSIQEEGEQVWALEELAGGLVQVQEWEQVKEVIGSIQEEGERAWALVELAGGLVQAQEWEQAKEVIGSIQEEGERAWALVGLAGGLVQAQEWEQAKKVWEQAKEVIGSIQGEGKRARALVELTRGLVRAQEWEQAKGVIGSIQEEGERVWALEELIRGLVQAQEWEQAKEVIGTIRDDKKRAEALRELGKVLTVVDQCELLQLVQQSWLQVETRKNAIDLLPLVAELIPLQPTLAQACCEAFTWVDDFLRG